MAGRQGGALAANLALTPGARHPPGAKTTLEAAARGDEDAIVEAMEKLTAKNSEG